jgi:hypothetical protein
MNCQGYLQREEHEQWLIVPCVVDATSRKS